MFLADILFAMMSLPETYSGCDIYEQYYRRYHKGCTPACRMHLFKRRVGGVLGYQHRYVRRGTGKVILRPAVRKHRREQQRSSFTTYTG